MDSEIESTRIFWRKKYFNVTDEQARDPRPFAEVLDDMDKDAEFVEKYIKNVSLMNTRQVHFILSVNILKMII
jgi:hypothetical protein